MRVQYDCKGNHQLQRGELELEVRRHESAETHANGKAAEHEVEDMTAAIGLREMRRQAVGPTVGLFEQVHRRADIVRLRAAGAILAPFVTDLLLGNISR